MTPDPTMNPSSPSQPQPPSVTTSPTSVAQDLKHMTSDHDLLAPAKLPTPRRPSKLSPVGTPRLGSRSPSSIPSSPSSIHSSSSAIFERDIEPLPNSMFAMPMAGGETATMTTLNHHHPYSQTAFLESSVPAVLSSAATALADSSDPASKDSPMNISVIIPAASSPQQATMGMTSPGKIPPPSRSMSIPVSSANSTGGSAVASRSSSPTRRSFSVAINGSPEHRPTIFDRQPQPPASVTSGSPSPPSLSPLATAVPLPGPAMDSQYTQNKRLSFISYNDLLNCAPVSSTLLSTLTSPANDIAPPHIPAVQGTGSAAPTESMGEEGGEWIGGEWEREGFGRGLEERLETVLKESRPPSMHLTAA